MKVAGWVQHSGTHQLFFDDCWWVSPTLSRIDSDTNSDPDYDKRNRNDAWLAGPLRA